MKRHSTHSLAALAATGIAAAASGAPAADAGKSAAEPVLSGPEASIPFVNHGGIYDFHVQDDKGIWVQERGGQWYYGKFFAPCFGIEFSITLGFVPGRGTTSFDRWSSVVSHDSGKCNLTSLRRSEPPPGLKPRKARAEKIKAEGAPATPQ